MTTESDFSTFTEEAQDIPDTPLVSETVTPNADETLEAPSSESPSISEITDVEPVVSQAPETTPTSMESGASLEEIEKRTRQLEEQRAKHEDLLARDRTIKELEQEAINMERSLTEQGLSDQEAQRQTMSHLQGRVNEIQGQRNLQAQQQNLQGKRNASLHFAKKYNLGIDHIAELETAANPQDMEIKAKTISGMAAKDKEIADLKARLAPAQAFDSNTPTPAASTNDERLLDAYLAGDRSTAATAAAAKLLGI
jgi:hypothetical protein|tara:strand:+ start:6896 stop:7657 length:762 start_codon:yes stop_codon:yes gene_type:complete